MGICSIWWRVSPSVRRMLSTSPKYSIAFWVSLWAGMWLSWLSADVACFARDYVAGCQISTRSALDSLCLKGWCHDSCEPLPRAEDEVGEDWAVNGGGSAMSSSRRLGDESCSNGTRAFKPLGIRGTHREEVDNRVHGHDESSSVRPRVASTFMTSCVSRSTTSCFSGVYWIFPTTSSRLGEGAYDRDSL